MLRLKGLRAGYGDLEILHGLDMEVRDGQIVALIGANGAGKTTTLKSVSGLLEARAGHIEFDEQEITKWHTKRIVQSGLVQVPEGRHLFREMTVTENLELGAYRRGRKEKAETLAYVFELFPKLAERRRQLAGTLSGGERQMLAIGRALMTKPRLLMLDEPSLGLAPLIVRNIFEIVAEIRNSGTTVLIVEQNAVQTLAIADWGYVLQNGEIVLGGTGAELLKNEQIRAAYLGL